MPTAINHGVALYYETDGEGPLVAFCGDVGLGAWQWGWQHAGVAGPYEALVWDARGCGRSDPPPGPARIETLAADLEAVLRDHGGRGVHLVGAGLGGMVALQFALGSSRPRSLTLVATAAAGDAYNPAPLAADPGDPEAIRESLEATFSREFLQEHPDEVSKIVEWRLAEDASPAAREHLVAALETFGVADRLYEVEVPALVVHGEDDAMVPPARGRELTDDLPRGEFVPVDDAGHLVHVEASGVVNDHLLGFLDEHAD